MKTIAIFVDAANMFFAQKDNGWFLDFGKLLFHLKRNVTLHGAYYYTATPSYDQTEKIKKYRLYRRFLISQGFTVKEKEVKVIKLSDGTSKLKGNLDIELVMDMIVNKDSYEEAILLGGDSDFVQLVSKSKF